MPDLGSYSVYVLSAYCVSFVLLALIIFTSLRRSAKTLAELSDIEARRDAAREAAKNG